MVSISQLFVYPIKGCAGLAVNDWPLDRTGLRHDRQWMLIDEDHRFVSQREVPSLALCRIALIATGWRIRFDGASQEITIPFVPNDGHTALVRIWDDHVQAITGWPMWDSFFSQALGKKVQLAFFDATSQRRVDPRFAKQPHYTFFSDGYPLLLLGSASLAYLNTQLDASIDWDRFRPNIVVETLEPHIEDNWPFLLHEQYQLHLVKPCARCVVTTIDQNTAQPGKEPLRTLARYRQRENKILFGMNTLVHEQHEDAVVCIGDQLRPSSTSLV